MAWCSERIQVEEATEPKSGEMDGKVSSPARGIWSRNKCNKCNKAMFAGGFCVIESVTRSVTCSRKRNPPTRGAHRRQRRKQSKRSRRKLLPPGRGSELG